MGPTLPGVMRPLAEQARRIRYYLTSFCSSLVPGWWYRGQLDHLLAEAPPGLIDGLRERVDYYLRGRQPLTLGGDSVPIGDLRSDGHTTYYFDLLTTLRYFPCHLRLSYRFGDITAIPPTPSVVKSRPIAPHSPNAVLMKLNQIRHYRDIDDPVPFRAKSDTVVWRGKCHGRPNRVACVERHHATAGCDIGDSNPRTRGRTGWKPYLTIADQLQHKFVLSLEGNDVATNLKWIMASNSLCLMPRPRFETWFMEGRLVAGVHYVEVRDDLGDLLEKREHYRAHPEEAEAIIANAKRHAAQFRDARLERLLGVLVMHKYFHLSGQWQAA